MIKLKRILLFSSLGLMAFVKPNAANFTVAANGSGDFNTVQAAIDACPDNERSFIFIKNGTYYGQTSIGSKTVASTKFISLIGENRDSVILTYDKSFATVTTFEATTTFQIYAKNFYSENVTFVNSAGNTGQALALYSAGDMAIFKNCAFKGYQDTFRSKKGTRGYLLNCWVEGAVDFIYAGGTFYYDNCIINCIRAGGFIAAPEDAYATVPKTSTATGIFLRLGFIFNNCTIQGPSSVAANSFYLGRPWTDYAGAIYLNCKLSNQVINTGWSIMGSSTYLTACFVEYNSMNMDGTPSDTTKRVSWSKQLKKSDVDNFLTPSAFFARSYTTTFDPFSSLSQVAAPTNLALTGTQLSWNAVSNAASYVVYSGDKMVGTTKTNSFTLSSSMPNLSVRALNAIGVLSESSQLVSSISKVTEQALKYRIANNFIVFEKEVKIKIYSLNGELVTRSSGYVARLSLVGLTPGSYLFVAESQEGYLSRDKIIIHA